MTCQPKAAKAQVTRAQSPAIGGGNNIIRVLYRKVDARIDRENKSGMSGAVARREASTNRPCTYVRSGKN